MNAAELFNNEPNPVKHASGEVLFKAGDPRDAMYVVLEGTLDILINGRLVQKCVRGDIIGEMAIIDNSPTAAP